MTIVRREPSALSLIIGGFVVGAAIFGAII